VRESEADERVDFMREHDVRERVHEWYVWKSEARERESRPHERECDVRERLNERYVLESKVRERTCSS